MGTGGVGGSGGVRRADSTPGITEDSESARELREKKRVLAALVVHDLRSPLSGVQGYLQLLREELVEDPAHSQTALSYLDDAVTLVGKALGLVATILDVDELEDGILRAQLAPVRIIELIERAKSGNRAQFEVRGLAIDVEVDPDMVVRLDRDLFARILENLIDNSARYAPRNGRCAIAVRRRAGRGDRDRQQRPAGARVGARADLRSLLPGRGAARRGACEPRPGPVLLQARGGGPRWHDPRRATRRSGRRVRRPDPGVGRGAAA
ncbi:MAG: hypothetical protein IPQ07_05090 [Myxococcales bacterium]|nr:hypothetical protein [Myxococcales bacterium]